ncbi:MAG: hypothetical protein R6U01_06860 [Halorubrum sp.]|uniref:hypothetical protein n=1 Tax=Halorubrum sp. TaxID=1879286 RepID=UPI003970B6C5
MNAVPLSGTGAGPRPDPTTFTHAATERRTADGAAIDQRTPARLTTDRPTTQHPTDDATTE